MRIIIAGSRDINNYPWIKACINHCDIDITEIVSGGARGVDAAGEQYAEEYNITVTHFPANWDKHGKAAGPIRNKEMAEYVSPNGGLILFWDGKSKGSANMLLWAKKTNLLIWEFIVND